jgi:hypothetical protein
VPTGDGEVKAPPRGRSAQMAVPLEPEPMGLRGAITGPIQEPGRVSIYVAVIDRLIAFQGWRDHFRGGRNAGHVVSKYIHDPFLIHTAGRASRLSR